MVRISARLVSTKRLFAISAVVVLLALGSLALLLWGTTQGGPPRGGLTRAQAIQAAWTHVDKGAVAVSSAEVRRDFNTGFDLPIHRWAWVVTFSGQWHLLCQGGPEGCDPTTEWVAIDYYTGDWIASQHSYPSGK
jgi:hypothetical protein